MRAAVVCSICKVFSTVDSMYHPRLRLLTICLGGLLVASSVSSGSLFPQSPQITTQPTALWQLPTSEQMQQSLESCGTEHDAPRRLRCLVEQLGLWTDKLGYNAKRIAKIFAGYNQMEELQLVIQYCNQRERHEEEPVQWAYQAYRCATSGRFGGWVKDYVKSKRRFK